MVLCLVVFKVPVYIYIYIQSAFWVPIEIIIIMFVF